MVDAGQFDIGDIDFDNVTFGDEKSPDELSGDQPRARRTRSDAGVKRGPRGTRGTKKHNELKELLMGPYTQLAMGLSVLSPTATGVMIHRSEQTVNSIIRIAEKHPAFMKSLETASGISAYTDAVQTVLLMCVAMLIDFNRLPPDAPIAHLLGVTEVYNEMNPKQDASQENAYLFPTTASA